MYYFVSSEEEEEAEKKTEQLKLVKEFRFILNSLSSNKLE